MAGLVRAIFGEFYRESLKGTTVQTHEKTFYDGAGDQF
jgi:hypothetical protein